MGRTLGDPADPLLVSVRSGAKFSMPGMMDTVLNLGLNDRSVLGLAQSTGDERFAFDSYRRFISMYGRIVLDIEAEAFDKPLDDLKEKIGAATDADVPAGDLRKLCTRYKRIVEKHTGEAFPQEPMAQLKGAIEAVFASWNGPRAIAYRTRERISHDLGTAVNVQAMVFGNRDEQSGTGVGFTRDPATGAKGEYGDFLVNAQGEDVVAGIRNTEPLSALKGHFPEIHDELLAIFARLEKHYRDMCDTEFTIEQGKLWMLQTARRQAHRRGGPEDGRRHGEGLPPQPRRRPHAGDRRAPRPGAAPAVRGRRPRGDRQGPARLAGCRGRPGVLHRRRRGRRRRPGRAGGARAHRDLARGRARHAGGRGHPHRPRRAGQPRRGRRPRLGHPRRRGRRGPAHLLRPLHRRRRDREGGRRHLARRHHRRGGARRGRAVDLRAAGRVPDDPRLGRQGAEGQARRPGQRRQRPRRHQRPRSSAPRASASAAPSTCSSARTACRSCAA